MTTFCRILTENFNVMSIIQRICAGNLEEDDEISVLYVTVTVIFYLAL